MNKSTYVSLLLLVLWYALMSYSDNPPSGKTGAPGDTLCTDCHGGNNPNGFDGSVTISGIPTSVMPSTTYAVTVTSSNPNHLANRAGFEFLALNGNNTNVGTLATVNSEVSLVNGSGSRTYARHHPAKNFGANTSVSWTFNWTSPATSTNNTLKFYASSVIANGSNSSGDLVVATIFSAVLSTSGDPLTVTILGSSDVSCNGGSNGAISAQASGGTPPYTYTWSNSQTGATISNLTAGTYTVTVSASGATATASAVIDQPGPISINITNQTNITCFTPTASVTVAASGGTPGFSYHWANGSSSPTYSTTTAGTYTVTATDAAGCTKTKSVIITANTTPPTVSIQPPPQLTCQNPLFQLNANGSSSGPSYTYSWSTNGGHIISGETTLTPTIDQSGTYCVTITNNTTGCTASSCVTVTDNIVLPGNVVATGSAITCSNTIAQLSGSTSTSGSTFHWTGPNNFSSNLQNPTTTVAGIYTLQVTAPNGCADFDTANVALNTSPPGASATGGTLTCSSTAVTLHGNSPASGALYAWVGPNGYTSASQNPQVSAAGTYTVAVLGTNGCTSTATTQVVSNTDPPGASATGGILTCTNTTATLQSNSPASGTSYSWTGPNGFTSTQQNPGASEAGTYTVSVLGSNGCTSTANASVTTDNTPPGVSATGGILNCNNPTVQLQGNSPDTGVTYQWTGPDGFSSNEQNPQVSVAGIYFVTARGNNGCSAVATTEVSQDISVPDVHASGDTITCAKPSVTLLGSSSANVSFSWTGPGGFSSNIQNPEVSVSGQYYLTATGLNGCQGLDSTVVYDNTTSPLVSSTSSNVITCAQSQTTLIGTSNTPGSVFHWEGPDGFTADTESATTNLTGPFILTVTAPNGCSASSQVSTESSTTPPVIQATGGEITCAQTSAPVQGTVDGSTASFEWSGPDGTTYNTLSFETGTPGNYELHAIGANGCESFATAAVIENNTAPVVNAGLDIQTDLSVAAQLDASLTTLGANIVFSWSTLSGNIVSGTENTLQPLVDQFGEYCLSVTNTQTGCSASDCVLVSTSLPLGGAITDITPYLCNGVDGGSLTVTATGGQPPYEYLWSDGQTSATAGDLAIGTYTVTIYDSTQDSVTISGSIEGVPSVSISGSGTITCSTPALTLHAETSGTVAAYAWYYLGDPAGDQADLTVSAPGTYLLTVTYSNGCVSSATALVNENVTSPEVIILNPDEITCTHPTVEITAISLNGQNCTAHWTTVNGHILSGGDTFTAVVDAPGYYDVTIQCDNGCSAIMQVIVTANQNPPAVDAIGGELNCSNPQVQLQGIIDPAYDVLWEGPNGYSSTETNPVVTQPGIYTLTGTDPVNGCSAQAQAEVTLSNGFPLVDAGPDLVITCSVTTVEAPFQTSQGDIVYSWTAIIGTFQYNTDSTLVLFTSPGQYELTGTNVITGCTASDIMNVEEDYSTPQVDAGAVGTLNCQTNSLTLQGSVSGNTNLFYWTNDFDIFGENDLHPEVMVAGEYCLVAVSSSSGCSASDCVEVLAPVPPEIQLIGVQNVSCHGAADGSIFVNVQGAEPISYAWSNGGSSSIDEFLAPGSYTVSITDANDCVVTSGATVNQPDSLTLALAGIGNETDNMSNGFIDVTVEGGTFSYTYQWSGPNGFTADTEDLTDIGAGTYVLSITDGHGCMQTGTFVVDNLVGTGTAITDEQILLYPNPSDGRLFIAFGSSWQNSSLRVYNTSGEQVYALNRLDNIHQLDLRGFASGIYAFRFVKEGKAVVYKIRIGDL